MEQPVIFIFGPSGSGKSCASCGLVRGAGFLHVDIDQNCPFERNGFPVAWDKDFGHVNIAELASTVRERASAQGRKGAVVSFPTIHVLSLQQVQEASRARICTIVLWGSKDECIAARRARSQKNRVKFDQERYDRKNRRSFETYARPEYEHVRLRAFRPDGGRWSEEEMTALVLRQCAG